jgi:hypothetical protein
MFFDDIATTLTGWLVKGAWEGTKFTAKMIASASATAKNSEMKTGELTELLSSAQRGNSDAQCELAIYYAEKKDYETANYWLSKSAQQGNAQALEIIDLLQK